MPGLSTDEFVRALSTMPRPGGRQTDFLQAHAAAPGRASTMSKLAEGVRYKNYRPVNLLYGKLAARIAEVSRREPSIWLLMDGAKPDSISNAHWVLVMRPEFAAALEQVGWVRPAAA